MTCSNFCNSSCPEPVPVTINQNIIKIADSTIEATTELKMLTGVQWVLSNTPWQPTGMSVFVGGAIQAGGVDYTVSGNTIIFHDPGVVGLPAVAIYEYLSSSSGYTIDSAGTCKPLMVDEPDLADIPAGYLILDGGNLQGVAGEGYLISEYGALSSIVGTSLNTASCPTGRFADGIFKSLHMHGGSMVSFFDVIKY